MGGRLIFKVTGRSNLAKLASGSKPSGCVGYWRLRHDEASRLLKPKRSSSRNVAMKETVAPQEIAV